jgi:hypothetical protein
MKKAVVNTFRRHGRRKRPRVTPPGSTPVTTATLAKETSWTDLPKRMVLRTLGEAPKPAKLVELRKLRAARNLRDAMGTPSGVPEPNKSGVGVIIREGSKIFLETNSPRGRRSCPLHRQPASKNLKDLQDTKTTVFKGKLPNGQKCELETTFDVPEHLEAQGVSLVVRKMTIGETTVTDLAVFNPEYVKLMHTASWTTRTKKRLEEQTKAKGATPVV